MLNFSTAEIEYKYKFNVYTPSETHKLQTPLFKKKKKSFLKILSYPYANRETQMTDSSLQKNSSGFILRFFEGCVVSIHYQRHTKYKLATLRHGVK